MTRIVIPPEIADELPAEAVRRCLANLGLVLDGLYGPDREVTARWASDAWADLLCADPPCGRRATVRLESGAWCAAHALRELQEGQGQGPRAEGQGGTDVHGMWP